MTSSLPGLIVVFRFDDGHQIARITNRYQGYYDWQRIKEGYEAQYVVLDLDGDRILRFAFTDLHVEQPALPRWRAGAMYENTLGDKDKTWIKWVLSFLEEMVVPLDERLDGEWANLRFPVFFPDTLWEKAERAGEDLDRQIDVFSQRYRALPRDQSKSTNQAKIALTQEVQRLASEFVIDLFSAPGFHAGLNYRSDGVTITSATVDIGSNVLRFKVRYNRDYEGYGWTIQDETLADTLLNRPSFRLLWSSLVHHILPDHLPVFHRESERETWMAQNTQPGDPTFDVTPFLALDADSPILWPHDRFIAFWRALPENVRAGTLR